MDRKQCSQVSTLKCNGHTAAPYGGIQSILLLQCAEVSTKNRYKWIQAPVLSSYSCHRFNLSSPGYKLQDFVNNILTLKNLNSSQLETNLSFETTTLVEYSSKTIAQIINDVYLQIVTRVTHSAITMPPLPTGFLNSACYFTGLVV